MLKDKNVIVDILGPGELTVLHFNLTRKPLDNLKVRQAIAYALKRHEFRELDGLSISEDGISPVAPGHLGYTSVF